MKELTFGKVPIIFPKALIFLVARGWMVQVVGKQTCDFRVIQWLLEASDWQELPDIQVLDSRTHTFNDIYLDEKTLIHQGEYNHFVYSPTFFTDGKREEIKLVNLVNGYGHSKQWIAPNFNPSITQSMPLTYELR